MTRVIIKNTGPIQKRIDAETVARLLGAEKTNVKIDTKRSPISLYGLRLFLFDRLHSSGDRPKLAETKRVRKGIALPREDWERLETLATYLTETEGANVSAGQVGAALIHVGLSELELRNPRKRAVSKKNIGSKSS